MPTARGRCSLLGLVPLMLFSSLGTWGFSPSKSSVDKGKRQAGEVWAECPKRSRQGSGGKQRGLGKGVRATHGGRGDWWSPGGHASEQAPGRGLRFQQWPPEGAAQTHPTR